MTLIIGEKATQKLIGMPRALAVVEKVLRDRAAGKVRRLSRGRLRGNRKGLNIMAAWHADWDLFCMRFYSGKRTSSIALHDGRTGEFVALMNASYLAPLRTGATSGVAAKYLGPPAARVLGVIGPGRQAIFQVEAIVESTGVPTVLVYGRNGANRRRFIRTMGKRIQAELKQALSLKEIEAQSDIIVLATDSKVPILDGAFLKNDVLVISIGANQPIKHEVSAELIRRMDLIVTDDLPTAQIDAGDLIAAHEAGALQWENVLPLDLVVASNKLNGRPKKILFQSNGIGDDALAVARYVLNAIRRKRIKVTRVSEI
ncbi:MAG: ornithine cyclodeaminase family protein [Deltaproteobacteria bacterium]|nr:ornithine cyclodeaminase family protein [Deltaproteobacteria bacterium]